MKPGRFRIATGVAVLMLALGGCGDDPAAPPPTGPLAETLADIGGGGASGSLGVGWADPQLVEESSAGAQVIADALGPNAGTVIEAARRLRRRFDFDPLSAERLISVGGSYAFGLRLDGVDGRQLRRALVAEGGRARRASPLGIVVVRGFGVGSHAQR